MKKLTNANPHENAYEKSHVVLCRAECGNCRLLSGLRYKGSLLELNGGAGETNSRRKAGKATTQASNTNAKQQDLTELLKIYKWWDEKNCQSSCPTPGPLEAKALKSRPAP